MGNTASNSQPAGVVTSKQGSRSWATTDNTMSAPLSFLIREQVQCLCEGGKKCTRENPASQRGPNAVAGLHSNWVGEHLLATARPWQEHVIKYDLVTKFKELNVGMILNLQEVGEHESCGPGNLASSGFTYNPELFMAAKIGFYNLSWRDMGVPTLDKMMDIVQIMHYTTVVEQKKIAVHCHAGLGRTGLAIACFLLASGEAASAARAVDMVRQHRPGALQTNAQVMFVSIFEQYLQHLRCLFNVADMHKLNLGNEGYTLTKMCRRISRSMSAHGPAVSDPLGVVAVATAALSGSGAAAVLGPAGLPLLALSSCGTNTPKAAAALQSVADAQADWANASYEPMSDSEAAQMMSAAEAGATAMLNLKNSGASEGVMLHAKRLSGGGGSMKLVCNLKAIKEETDKPVHVIETETAVTEVYGDGLTIIRSAQSCRKLPVPRAATAEEQVRDRLITMTDLGLDCQMPWNEKFHIKPEAFTAEGWLPEAPSSYDEALTRQQRLLHGNERRQSLRLHKLLKAAAKALTTGATAYNAVPEHWDTCPAPATMAAGLSAAGHGISGPLKRSHTRSRSSAAAELLALTASIGTLEASSSGSNASHSHPSTPVKSLSSKSLKVSAATAAAAAAAVTGLSLASGPGAMVPAPGVSLLPAGIHLGVPGTSPCNSAGSTRASSGDDGSGVASSFYGSCLAGCCAPSFAAGLLTALIYKGRFPEEYESQWTSCPRLMALGLAEGHSMCAQLHSVKLALNSGDCTPLETASTAVAVVVLSDWFEGFVSEAISEQTLQLLVNEEEAMLTQAHNAAAAARDAAAANKQLHKPVPRRQHCQHGVVPKLKLPQKGSSNSSDHEVPAQATLAAAAPAAAAELAETEDVALLHHQALARNICCQFAAYEQDLFLVLAAVLRHVRHASLDDSRLHSWMLDGAQQKQQQQQDRSSAAEGDGLGDLHYQHMQAAAAGLAGGLNGSGGGSQQLQGGQQAAMGLMHAPEQQVVESEVDAAMAALYQVVASWVLGPMTLACKAALQAVGAFLQYLTVDDVAYGQLLKASHEQQGLKKSHSQPANYSSDSLESMLSNNGNNPSTPRSQLRARILKSATEHGLVAPRSLGGPACSSSGGKASAGGAGHGKGKSNLGLPHSASSPTVALQRGGSAGSSPAGSPRKLTLGASSCSSASGEECGCSKGWAGSVSSLFGYRKSCKRLHLEPAQQQQQTAPGEQPKVAVQKSDGAAQTGASLCGGAGAVAHGSLIEESSSSQVVHPGSRELCVGRQKERVAASPAADLVAELAALPGRQQSPHPKDFFLDSEEPEAVGGCSTELTGSLSSPTRSVSPVQPGSSSRVSAAGKHTASHHLPAIRPSAAGATALGMAGTAAASSSSSSPASSGQFAPGQLCGAAAAAATQPVPVQQDCTAPTASTSMCSSVASSFIHPTAGGLAGAFLAGNSNAATASAQGAMSNTAGISAVASSVDLAASCQMLSVSALSDLQLPSFASSMSVAESLALAQSRQSWDPAAG